MMLKLKIIVTRILLALGYQGTVRKVRNVYHNEDGSIHSCRMVYTALLFGQPLISATSEELIADCLIFLGLQGQWNVLKGYNTERIPVKHKETLEKYIVGGD